MTTPLILAASGPVEITAAASDRKGPPRFAIDAYHGAELVVAGFELPIVVDLAGMKAASRILANLDHEPRRRVGEVDQVENDGRRLRLAGVVSVVSAASKEFVRSARRGFSWAASIEAQPKRLEQVAAGKSAEANGRTFRGPIFIARQSELTGIAILSRGADAGARVVLAQVRPMFTDWLSEMGINTSNMTADQLAACHANWRGENVVTAEDRTAVLPLIHAAPADPVQAEAARVRQIEAAVRGEWGAAEPQVADLRARAIEGDLTVDQLLAELRPIRAKCLEARLPEGHTVHGRAPRDSNVIEAALCQAAGIACEKHYPERVLQAAHDAFHGRLGIQQLLLTAAAESGLRVLPGERITSGSLRKILAYALPGDGPAIHAAGWSTNTLSGILSNVANKSLLMGWEEGDQTWRQVAQIKPVNDFKQATSYRMLDSLEYEQVGAGGEIKHGTLSEESYTRQARTYAKMLSLTRTDIINDDLGAFNDLRIRIGRGAIQKFNNVFWAAFINNASWFTSGNGNYIEGATTTLLTDGVGLQAAVLKFRQMVSSDGKRLDGEPSILLVPPELEFAARRLYQSTNVIATGDTDAVMASDNPFFGLYRPIVQTRLSDSAFTGNSATAWFLLRNPAIAAVVVASFLGGQQSPTVESSEADFNVLGVSFRGYHDFGADKTVDYPAGVKSKGAS